MAEYYAVLKKAVGGLEAGSAEGRRAVYDKARNALIGQLKAIDPPLAASEISRQRLELEEAIRRVERETVAEAQGARRARPTEAEPAPNTAPEGPQPVPAAAPQQSGPPSPQDIFRRAIQEAEARGAAAGYPQERAPTRPVVPYDGATAAPPGNWVQGGRPEYRTDTPQGSTAARLAPEYDDDWQSRDTESNQPPEPYSDRRSRSRPPGRRRQQEDYLEDAETPEPESPARRSRLPTILLFLLIVVMIGGIGALAWSQRTMITDLLASFDSGSTEAVAPEPVPAPPDSQSKSEDRLAGRSEDSSGVRVIGDSGVPAPPDVSSDPIADTIAGMPSTIDSGTADGQSAVLYEEPLDAAAAAAGVTAIDAVINWRFVEDGTSGPEISADVKVPERGMTIGLVIRRNTDPTLPASHLVETVINTPPDFPGKGIRSVPRLVLKLSEDERGEPLIGAAAKVADGFFWIALSAAEADVARNLRLLRERPWIDLPIVYETGQRAILTFEKGPQGTEVFENAFAAWSTG
jgi:hypothetical protein